MNKDIRYEIEQILNEQLIRSYELRNDTIEEITERILRVVGICGECGQRVIK